MLFRDGLAPSHARFYERLAVKWPWDAAAARALGRRPVSLAVKPVGEPDAGNPHVRFDERGRETERLSVDTALILDSTELLSTDKGCDKQ
jgi:hypothetical protein